MAMIANRLSSRFCLARTRGRSGRRALPLMRRICRTNPTAARSLPCCDGGNAAIEFGLLAPILLLILAGVADLGLVLHSRFALNTEVSSAANYSLMRGGNVTDVEEFEAQVEKFLLDGGVETASAELNCYCQKEASGGAVELESAACGGGCADGTSSGRYVEITASSSYTSLFKEYAFGSDGASVRTLVRVD